VQAPGFSFYVASCYFQYSDEIEGHLRHLEMVLRTLRGKRLLIAVDSNARSSLWGSQRSDERGEKFEELIREFNMQILNKRTEPNLLDGKGFVLHRCNPGVVLHEPIRRRVEG